MVIPQELDEYVNDYKIHVFDIAFLEDEQVKMFQSNFRIVADYFVQIRKNKDYIPSDETVEHMDAVLKLMAVLTNDNRFEEIQQSKGELRTMCEVLDRAEEKGIEKGMEQGEKQKMIQLVSKKLDKGKTVGQIAEDLEETTEYIQTIIDEMGK